MNPRTVVHFERGIRKRAAQRLICGAPLAATRAQAPKRSPVVSSEALHGAVEAEAGARFGRGLLPFAHSSHPKRIRYGA